MDGDELRRRRRELGLSQGAMATRLGIAPNTVARWERGALPITRPAMLDAMLDRLEAERAGGAPLAAEHGAGRP